MLPCPTPAREASRVVRARVAQPQAPQEALKRLLQGVVESALEPVKQEQARIARQLGLQAEATMRTQIQQHHEAGHASLRLHMTTGKQLAEYTAAGATPTHPTQLGVFFRDDLPLSAVLQRFRVAQVLLAQTFARCGERGEPLGRPPSTARRPHNTMIQGQLVSSSCLPRCGVRACVLRTGAWPCCSSRWTSTRLRSTPCCAAWRKCTRSGRTTGRARCAHCGRPWLTRQRFACGRASSPPGCCSCVRAVGPGGAGRAVRLHGRGHLAAEDDGGDQGESRFVRAALDRRMLPPPALPRFAVRVCARALVPLGVLQKLLAAGEDEAEQLKVLSGPLGLVLAIFAALGEDQHWPFNPAAERRAITSLADIPRLAQDELDVDVRGELQVGALVESCVGRVWRGGEHLHAHVGCAACGAHGRRDVQRLSWVRLHTCVQVLTNSIRMHVGEIKVGSVGLEKAKEQLLLALDVLTWAACTATGLPKSSVSREGRLYLPAHEYKAGWSGAQHLADGTPFIIRTI